MKPKHLLTLLFVSLTYATTVLAQPDIKTQRAAGGRDNDFLLCGDSTTDGGFIVGGYSYSGISGQKTDTSRGFNDYWIIKYNSSGKIEWDKTIGGDGGDILNAIQQTSDGGYILGGTSNSNKSGEKSEDSHGDGGDYWVVKLDANGNVQWDRTIGGDDDDDLHAIQQTSDGGYILGSTSNSNKSGDKTEDLRGPYTYTYDYWIVKTDSKGNVEWNKTIGGSNSDILSAIQQTIDGGYIVGGYSNSDTGFEKTKSSYTQCTGFPPRCSITYDYWIVKLNNHGNIQWDKTIIGSDHDKLAALQQTKDNGYILGGTSNSTKFGDKSESSRGLEPITSRVDDFWVVKLDSTGNKQWDKTIGGYCWEDLQSLQQTSDEGYILGGISCSDISAEKTENSRGGNDYWLVKINHKGKVVWDKTIGGSNDDVLLKVLETHKNTFMIGGYSDSRISGDKTVPARGEYDYWLVKLRYNKAGDTAMVASASKNYVQIKKTGDRFSAYPNPAKDILYLQNNGRATTFTLTNQSGKLLLMQRINGNGSINIAHLPSGFYFLKDNSTGIMQKIIVAK